MESYIGGNRGRAKSLPDIPLACPLKKQITF